MIEKEEKKTTHRRRRRIKHLRRLAYLSLSLSLSLSVLFGKNLYYFVSSSSSPRVLGCNASCSPLSGQAGPVDGCCCCCCCCCCCREFIRMIWGRCSELPFSRFRIPFMTRFSLTVLLNLQAKQMMTIKRRMITTIRVTVISVPATEATGSRMQLEFTWLRRTGTVSYKHFFCLFFAVVGIGIKRSYILIYTMVQKKLKSEKCLTKFETKSC